MSRISYDRVIPLLAGQRPASRSNRTYQRYYRLTVQAGESDIQSFYFQKGLKSHQAKLDKMKAGYKDIAEIVNNNDMDYFIAKVHKLEDQLQKIKSEDHALFIKIFACETLQNDIDYCKDLIQIKNQFGKLKNLDELLEDEESMMKIFST